MVYIHNLIKSVYSSSGGGGEVSMAKRAKRSTSASDDGNKTLIYKAEHIEITTEGLLSLALVQLPGISLGIFGIMKAFMNHGLSKQTFKDSLRCPYNQLKHVYIALLTFGILTLNL